MTQYIASQWPYLLIGATWGLLNNSPWKVVAGSVTCAFLAQCAASLS